MKVGIVQFPGSNCDRDAYHAFGSVLGVPTRMIFHKEASIGDSDVVVLPGGFSYGDYLRCGAIARFSPVMAAIVDHARRGGCVLGICNGFQVLCEAGLLPGALVRNDCLQFRCQMVRLRNDSQGPFGPGGRFPETLSLPIAHGEGNYRADEATLQRLRAQGQVLFRYHPDDAHPNGSADRIAGICNERGNIYGMMPHPERAIEPLHPSQDGRLVLEAILAQARQAVG